MDQFVGSLKGRQKVWERIILTSFKDYIMISNELAAMREMCNEQKLVELRERNILRAKEMIEKMGNKHLMHTTNRVNKTAYHGVLSCK